MQHALDLYRRQQAGCVVTGTNPVRYPGIVYGAHPYPVKALPWGSYFGYLQATYPVLATEFGFQNNGSSVYDESVYQPGLYRSELNDYLEQMRIGWMAWSFGPLWEPIMTLDWGYTPSEQGRFYRDKLLAAAGGQIPDTGVAHVAGITMSFLQARNNYKATAAVTVVDVNGKPVSGATVQGQFTGATTDSVSAVTGSSDGQATLTSSAKRGAGTWSFCVDNVLRSGWTYDAAANLVERCATVTAP